MATLPLIANCSVDSDCDLAQNQSDVILSCYVGVSWSEINGSFCDCVPGYGYVGDQCTQFGPQTRWQIFTSLLLLLVAAVYIIKGLRAILVISFSEQDFKKTLRFKFRNTIATFALSYASLIFVFIYGLCVLLDTINPEELTLILDQDSEERYLGPRYLFSNVVLTAALLLSIIGALNLPISLIEIAQTILHFENIEYSVQRLEMLVKVIRVMEVSFAVCVTFILGFRKYAAARYLTSVVCLASSLIIAAGVVNFKTVGEAYNFYVLQAAAREKERIAQLIQENKRISVDSKSSSRTKKEYTFRDDERFITEVNLVVNTSLVLIILFFLIFIFNIITAGRVSNFEEYAPVGAISSYFLMRDITYILGVALVAALYSYSSELIYRTKAKLETLQAEILEGRL